MVRQWYAQAAAHVGELCRIDIPDDTSHPHGTDERLFGLPQSMALATGVEYTTVERCLWAAKKSRAVKTGTSSFQTSANVGAFLTSFHAKP